MQKALLMPLGSEASLIHYARHVSGQCDDTTLVIPTRLAHALDTPDGCPFTVSTYDHTRGDDWSELLGPGEPAVTESLLIDAGRMPWIDLQAARLTHRQLGAEASIFYDGGQSDYCREHIAADPSGAVSGTVREYCDSGAGHRNRVPLAVMFSRRGSVDCSSSISDFESLVGCVEAHVRRTGGQVRWIGCHGVCAGAAPLESLLWLVERSGPGRGDRRAAPCHSSFGGKVRMEGAVHIGRGVNIGPDAILIGPAAIGDSATIGKGAVISRSIVLPGQSVPDYGHCHNTIVGPAGEQLLQESTGEPATPHCGREVIASVSRASEVAKKCLDVVGATAGLILLAPLFVIVALAIKLTSAGPVLYGQRRQGRGGVEFNCWKFRTMIPDADALKQTLRSKNQVDGPQFKITHDPRVTPIGQWLRRTNIDELPQLVNVLLGQMSLVGPRPSPDNENQWCPAWRRARLSVRPGITGLWQVARSTDRRITDFQEWIYFDSQYVERQSFSLDLQIIWQTVRVLLHLGCSPRWRERYLPKAHKAPPPQILLARRSRATQAFRSLTPPAFTKGR